MEDERPSDTRGSDIGIQISPTDGSWRLMLATRMMDELHDLSIVLERLALERLLVELALMALLDEVLGELAAKGHRVAGRDRELRSDPEDDRVASLVREAQSMLIVDEPVIQMILVDDLKHRQDEVVLAQYSTLTGHLLPAPMSPVGEAPHLDSLLIISIADLRRPEHGVARCVDDGCSIDRDERAISRLGHLRGVRREAASHTGHELAVDMFNLAVETKCNVEDERMGLMIERREDDHDRWIAHRGREPAEQTAELC